MNLADSFYIALCMTVLLLGVVYWFWTQTQYLQRKMNLLENIVYELKTLIDRGSSDPSTSPSTGPSSPPPPGRTDAGGPSAAAEPPSYPDFGEDDELLHEQLHSDTQRLSPSATATRDAPLVTKVPFEEVPDELQPGGVGSGLPSVEADVPFSDNTKPKGNVLDGMTLKELRRLAEQRSVAGASTMRKQALIDALRSDVSRVESSAESLSSEGSPVAEGSSNATKGGESKNSITMSEETTLSLQ